MENGLQVAMGGEGWGARITQIIRQAVESERENGTHTPDPQRTGGKQNLKGKATCTGEEGGQFQRREEGVRDSASDAIQRAHGVDLRRQEEDGVKG
jgi:hypothetical protein